MLELFVYGGLAVIFAALFIIGVRKSWDDPLLTLFAFICVTFIVVTVILGVETPSEQDFCNTEKRYYSLKEKVETVKKLDYSERVVFYPELSKEVENMNNLIEKHKFNYTSKWDGRNYSEKIAKLKPINLWE